MEALDATELILLLSDVPGIGEKTLSVILRRIAINRLSADQFLALLPEQWVSDFGMRKSAARELGASLPTLRIRAVEMSRQLRRAGVEMITLQDAAYPRRLLNEMDDPPPIFYAYGHLALLRGRLLAVANSNGASESVLAACDAAVTSALSAGWTPVTGHNRAPYQRPALASYRNGGRVCYVLDRGIMDAFDSELSRELFAAARIWSPTYNPASDLTLSTFGLCDHAIGDNNRRRDDVLFSLADAIVVGEARPGGQMEKNCLKALSQGRPVLSVMAKNRKADNIVAAGGVETEPENVARSLERIAASA